MKIQIFLVFCSLFGGSNFLYASLSGDMPEASKKTLHLHVGLHKTGTTSVQVWCMQNRSLLAERGIFYPIPLTPEWTQHSDLAPYVRSGRLDIIDAYLKKIVQEVGACEHILLSGEDFSQCHNSPHFEEFRNLLETYFAVKYIISFRNFKKQVASYIAHHLLIHRCFVLDPFASVYDAVAKKKLEISKIRTLFNQLGATTLSFEGQVRSGSLVSSFFKDGMGIEILIPSVHLNILGHNEAVNYGQITRQMTEIEIFFDVQNGCLSSLFAQSKLYFANAVAARVREVVVQLFGEEGSNIFLPEEFDAEMYVNLNPDLYETFIVAKRLEGDALLCAAVSHYCKYGKNEKRIFVPKGFDLLAYVQNNPDLQDVFYEQQGLRGKKLEQKAAEHYHLYGRGEVKNGLRVSN